MSDYNILIYGYGNPGRQDDGLGNALVQKIEAWVKEQAITGILFDSNYQLNIEDAAEVADKDLVIFVDASTEEIDDFILTPVDANTSVTFTSHAASPGYIVSLARDIYKNVPPVYLLHIKGYEWAFREGLSDQAKVNLNKAFLFMKELIRNPQKLIHACEHVNCNHDIE